jgi:hypothetical protein
MHCIASSMASSECRIADGGVGFCLSMLRCHAHHISYIRFDELMFPVFRNGSYDMKKQGTEAAFSVHVMFPKQTFLVGCNGACFCPPWMDFCAPVFFMTTNRWNNMFVMVKGRLTRWFSSEWIPHHKYLMLVDFSMDSDAMDAEFFLLPPSITAWWGVNAMAGSAWSSVLMKT